MSQFKKKSVKNIRSPRSFAASAQSLPRSLAELVAAKRAASRLMRATDGGPWEGPEKLSEWLWDGSRDQAREALNTDFIQGIKSGLLDPTGYGGYTIQDAVYCFNATGYFEIAKEKCKDSVLKEFLQSRISSYEEYTKVMFDQWHIRDPRGVAMGSAAAAYSAFEKGVAVKYDAIYLLIAMLPCEKLWEWLATQIKSGISDTNVYSFWITDNLGGGDKLANFVDNHAGRYGVERAKAKEIYQAAMSGEVGFFRSATENAN